MQSLALPALLEQAEHVPPLHEVHSVDRQSSQVLTLSHWYAAQLQVVVSVAPFAHAVHTPDESQAEQPAGVQSVQVPALSHSLESHEQSDTFAGLLEQAEQTPVLQEVQ